MKYITLTQAYGRDCKSAKEVKALWDAGKDFVIADIMNPAYGKYMNKQDAVKGETYMIRYSRDTKVWVVKG
jgi:hypothetical protein